MKTQCVDQVVGDILASWRYDISGIFPEMRGDYEAHFAECEHCRSRRRLHRTIDFALIGLATVSAFVFLLAFAVIHYLQPHHAFILEVSSLAGFALGRHMARRSARDAGTHRCRPGRTRGRPPRAPKAPRKDQRENP